MKEWKTPPECQEKAKSAGKQTERAKWEQILRHLYLNVWHKMVQNHSYASDKSVLHLISNKHNSHIAILLYYYSLWSEGLIVWADLDFSPKTVSKRFHWNEIGLRGMLRWTQPQAFLISKPLPMIFPHWCICHYRHLLETQTHAPETLSFSKNVR